MSYHLSSGVTLGDNYIVQGKQVTDAETLSQMSILAHETCVHITKPAVVTLLGGGEVLEIPSAPAAAGDRSQQRLNRGVAIRNQSLSMHAEVDTFAGYLGNDWEGTVEVRAFPPILGCRPTDCSVYWIPPSIDIVVNSACASKRSN